MKDPSVKNDGELMLDKLVEECFPKLKFGRLNDPEIIRQIMKNYKLLPIQQRYDDNS